MMANIIFFWSSQTLLENKIIAGSADMRLGDLLSYYATKWFPAAGAWIRFEKNVESSVESNPHLTPHYSQLYSKPHSSSWGPFSPLQIPFLFKGFQIPFARLKMILKNLTTRIALWIQINSFVFTSFEVPINNYNWLYYCHKCENNGIGIAKWDDKIEDKT